MVVVEWACDTCVLMAQFGCPQFHDNPSPAAYLPAPQPIPSGLILKLTTIALSYGSTAIHVTRPPNHKPWIQLTQIRAVKANQALVLLDPLVVTPPPISRLIIIKWERV